MAELLAQATDAEAIPPGEARPAGVVAEGEQPRV